MDRGCEKELRRAGALSRQLQQSRGVGKENLVQLFIGQPGLPDQFHFPTLVRPRRVRSEQHPLHAVPSGHVHELAGSNHAKV